jgi:8-oxo-dGTP diphosphatase
MDYFYTGYAVMALIRQHGCLLMVRHRSVGDEPEMWWLPGGKVEPGETLVQALERELREETGLQLQGSPSIAFLVQVMDNRAESLAFHVTCEVAGIFAPRDPDQLVVSVAWLPEQEALEQLATLTWYDTEPLRLWLLGDAATGAVYTDRRKK